MNYPDSDIEVKIGDLVGDEHSAKRYIVRIDGEIITLRLLRDPLFEFDHQTRIQNVKFLYRADNWMTMKDLEEIKEK
jgi:hypothetical protein